jgi:hypothetical protein
MECVAGLVLDVTSDGTHRFVTSLVLFPENFPFQVFNWVQRCELYFDPVALISCKTKDRYLDSGKTEKLRGPDEESIRNSFADVQGIVGPLLTGQKILPM